MKINKVYKGALCLSIGTLITKILGALYRVPLTKLMGVELLGVYQMVFPLYSALLDLSSAGVPSGLSKLIAKDKENKLSYLKGSLLTFGIIGLISFFAMYLLSKPIATFQGNAIATSAYKTLSPAVFMVSIICCFRGYFQGQLNMTPTAISQIIEQAVKFILGIVLLTRLTIFNNKVVSAIFAVVVGEFLALIYLLIVFLINNKRQKTTTLFKLSKPLFIERDSVVFYAKSVFKSAMPIMVLSVIFPLGCMVESSFIIRFLNSYGLNGVTVYGVYTGTAMTVINLPVSVCYGLSSVTVPTISGALKLGKGKLSTERLLILLTFIFALLGALACLIFAPLVVKILFPSLGGYQSLAVKLIRALSPSVIFIALLQTLHSVLIAKGKTFYAIKTAFISVVVKVVATALLVSIPNVNIFGAVVANTLCYLLAVLINLLYTKNYGNKTDQDRANANR